MPFINPLLLTFGLPGNYLAHLKFLLRGQEEMSVWKLALPLELVVMVWRWGWADGLLLTYVCANSSQPLFWGG